MAGLQLVAESLTTSLDVPGSLQQLNFTQNVAKLGINNSFSPVAGGAVNSIQIETSNNNLSGFRWIHETANATTGTNASIGTLRLCNFLNGDTVGQPLMSFDSIGNVTFAKNVNFGGSTGVTWASLGTPSAPVDFGGQKLLNVGTGSAGTDGVNLGQIQTLFNNLTLTSSKITDFSTAVTAFRLDQFAVPTSALNLNNQKISNLLMPTANQDAATKAFVDSHTWLAVSITDLATTVKAYTLNSFAAPTTSLNLNNQKISSLLDPVAAQDAATKNYVDTSTITTSRITDFATAVTSFRLDQFAIPTSNLNLNNLRIVNLANPTNAQDGVTKIYVDGHTWLSSSITDLATTVKGYSLSSFAAPTASLNLNSQKITNLLDPTTAQDAATKNYIDTHTWTSSQITNFALAVTAFRLDQFASPTTSLNMNSQKITSLLNPVSTQDAATKIYVDNHTWTTSQITDFASAVQTSLNTINLTGAVTGTLQSGNTIPTLQSATQSFNFWRQTMTWSPASGTNPSPTLPSGTPYYAITHVMPDNSSPPYYFHEAKVGNRTARLVLNPGLSSTQTGQFFFEYVNSDLSIDTIPFQIGMNSGSPLITIAALTNFSSNRLLNVGTGTATTDGVNLGQVQTLLNNLTLTTSRITDFATAVTAFRLDQFAIPTSNLNLNNLRIVNLTNPTNAQDGATKNYVDTSTITTSRITDFTTAVTSFRLDQFAPPQNPLNLTNIYFNNLSGLGIGTASAGTNRLTMASSAKMIVLYDGSGNDDQANFNGFGIATGSDTSGNATYSTAYNTSKGGSHLFYMGSGNLTMQITGDRAYIGSIVSASDFRKVVFNETANNQNQTTAIGVAPNMMRFQVPVSTTDFVFYSGVNATTSTEVARIKGTGDVSLSGTFYGRSPSGSMGMQGNTTTTSITTAGSWVKVAGATTSANLNQWTMPSSNRLTYGGTPSITSFINVYLTASQNDTSMAEIKFALYKNGVQISTSVISTQMTMSILSSLSFGVLTSVATNDYFELYVSHPVASRTVLVKNLIITTTQT